MVSHPKKIKVIAKYEAPAESIGNEAENADIQIKSNKCITFWREGKKNLALRGMTVTQYVVSQIVFQFCYLPAWIAAMIVQDYSPLWIFMLCYAVVQHTASMLPCPLLDPSWDNFMMLMPMFSSMWLDAAMLYFEPFGPHYTFLVEALYSTCAVGIYSVWKIYPQIGETQLSLTLTKRRAKWLFAMMSSALDSFSDIAMAANLIRVDKSSVFGWTILGLSMCFDGTVMVKSLYMENATFAQEVG